MPRGLYFAKTLFEGLIFGGGGLIYGGRFALQNRFAASLILRGKFTGFALFYFVGLYLKGRFKGGFLRYEFWGAYIWRGLYREGLIFGILR